MPTDTTIHTDILLELTTQTKTITLHILTIPTHHSLISFEDCSVTLHSIIQNCFSAYLRLNWNNSKIKVIDKPFNTTLPDLIPIPITLAKIAKSAIKNPNLYTALWIGMHGRYYAHPLSRATGERIDDPLLVRSSDQ